MKKKELHSAFLLSTIKESINEIVSEDDIQIDSLIKTLASFNIFYNEKNTIKSSSLINVIDNLISRGLPTIPPINIEEEFSEKFNISTKKIDEIGGISFINKISSKKFKKEIYKSFFIIEPRKKSNSNNKALTYFDSWEEHDSSEFEEYFYNNTLTKHFNQSIQQLIESQRSFKSILKCRKTKENNIHKKLGKDSDLFFNQRVDFSFDFPDSLNHKNGLIIEIDGSQHNDSNQEALDIKRDKIIEVNPYWDNTIRIKTSEIRNIDSNKINLINNFLTHPYYKVIKSNFEFPIYNKTLGLDAMQIALSPINIARIQKTIMFLFINGILDFNKKNISIGFIERDLPCGELAMKNLKELLNNFRKIINVNTSIPKFNYQIFTTKEFINSKLNKDIKTDTYPEPIKKYKFDIVIDISILDRTISDSNNNNLFYKKIKCNDIIYVRSSHSTKTNRIVNCSKPIKYEFSKNKSDEALTYFLNNIFRKKSFREGQLKIIKRALQHKNVIALLPTGAGKSLTYQLSTLLQPGISLIIDPLKSLMKDQNDNLNNAGIDLTTFINSSVRSPIEREDRSNEMVEGSYQFVFISPERMQIAEFRDYLKKMKKTLISFCVIDEAHCVSEWGHDFRTSYLSLGKNINSYCKSSSKKITILGLTGTASFDVLADVQRELNINDKTAIISPSKYERKELIFEISKTKSPKDLSKLKDEQKLNQFVSEQKQLLLHQNLNNLHQKKWSNGKYDSFENFIYNKDIINSGLVFCPHVNGSHGVSNVHSNIINQFDYTETISDVYHGGDSDDSDKFELIQNKFKANDYRFLVATKAFGMGIDKPNIRFTTHFNMPSSIESFYQEAGRAGRDRKKSYCKILYSGIETEYNGEKTSLDKRLMLSFFENSFKGSLKEKRVMWDLLYEISYPTNTSINNLSELLLMKGIDVKLKPWSGRGNRLYVNGPTFPQSYGHIDLDKEWCIPENGNGPDAHLKKYGFIAKDRKFMSKRYSKEILKNVLNIIVKNSNNENLVKWINKKTIKNSEDGIERIINKIDFYSKSKLEIGFTNDKPQKIHEILYDQDTNWDEKMVNNAYNFCLTDQDFIKNLEYQYYKVTKGNVKIDKKNDIIKLFRGMRTQLDTFKAIYRLTIIGIIDDYEIDYRTKSIALTISRKKDSDYVKNLIEYIGKYKSPADLSELPYEIDNSKGDTYLRKCCGRLIEFVYDEIAFKRKNAITSMENAIKMGIDNPEAFATEINTYFDSRYLTLLRDNYNETNISNAWNFLLSEKFEKSKDSLQHLNGACTRLLDDSPNHPVYLLLRSFSRFTIDDYDKNDASIDMEKAWTIFKNNNNWKRTEYLSNFNRFYNLIKDYDSNALQYLNLELIKEHLNWLKTFNKEYLK